MFARYSPRRMPDSRHDIAVRCDISGCHHGRGIGTFPLPGGREPDLCRTALVGSRLIGQKFSDPKYFWGRPSATSPQPYNGTASGGSNFGPLNPALLDAVKANVKLLHDADPGNTKPIPIELVTASASGLDPDISLAAADYQASRVAQARHMPLRPFKPSSGNTRPDRSSASSASPPSTYSNSIWRSTCCTNDRRGDGSIRMSC